MKSISSVIPTRPKLVTESKVECRRKNKQLKKKVKANNPKFDEELKLLIQKEQELKCKINNIEDRHFREVGELRTCIRHLEEELEPYRGLKVPHDFELSETFPKTIERIKSYHEQIDYEDREYLDMMLNVVKVNKNLANEIRKRIEKYKLK